jgi:hypothetical protein
MTCRTRADATFPTLSQFDCTADEETNLIREQHVNIQRSLPVFFPATKVTGVHTTPGMRTIVRHRAQLSVDAFPDRV